MLGNGHINKTHFIQTAKCEGSKVNGKSNNHIFYQVLHRRKETEIKIVVSTVTYKVAVPPEAFFFFNPHKLLMLLIWG